MPHTGEVEGLRVQREGTVARVLIDRPDRRNALTQRMWSAIPEITAALSADPQVRVAILSSSSPGVFSAGADVTEYREHAADLAWSAASQKVVGAALEALAAAAMPTVAAIDGPCFGGGAGLAIACDFRIATDTSTFAITPAKLGMVYPYTATVALVDLVGARNAKRILFTGETIDAAQAQAIGLVDRVVGADDLHGAVAEFIAPLLTVSAGSTRLMKQAVRWIQSGDRAATPRTDALVDTALQSADYLEGVTAFLERRTPNFGS